MTVRNTPEGLNPRALVNWRLTQLEEHQKEVSKTLASISNWVRGVMGSLILALLLLIFNLFVKKS